MKLTTLGLAALLAIPAGVASAQDAIENTIVTETMREFFMVSDPIQFAVVSGDLQAGPQGTFGRFPATSKHPNIPTPTATAPW